MIDQQIYITPFYRRWLGYPDFYQATAYSSYGGTVVQVQWFQSYLDLSGSIRLRPVEWRKKGWRPVECEFVDRGLV